MTEPTGGASFTTALVSSQILIPFEHHNAQVYVYASIQNNEKPSNPRAWNFYHVPVLIPSLHEIKNNWIWANDREVYCQKSNQISCLNHFWVQVKLMLGISVIETQAHLHPQLELLSLNENKLTDRGILVLMNALTNENRNLSILILEDLQLGPTAEIHLPRMLTINKTLTQLLLKNNQSKDRGMIAIALQNNISLLQLDVNNYDLTDRCFEAIIQLLSINRGLTEFVFIENEFSNETKE